ncbi:MAG: NAD(P)H-hydrate dehydratase [Candidatus Omnitrophica bacterium]|nr:NAD(P)H-hydrate dehydratase [Candidatus Omnitrophota bacterium]
MPEKMIPEKIAKRKFNAHKGDYGHILVLAGSLGLTGAAYLTAQAAILSGSGLVTLGIPEGLNSIMEVKLTEVMTKPLEQTEALTLSPAAMTQIRTILPACDALAIGPGLSRNAQTRKLVLRLLPIITKPAVLDADAISALTGKLKILKNLRADLVITPHPGEMSRLLNLSINDVQSERVKTAKDFAQNYQVVLVLKGYQTVVANPTGQVYINKTGNPGMATGGSGDVLTGIIGSLLGQGISAFSAAKLAVYVHGLAGDLAAREKGEISLIASDLLDKLPQALKTIVKN